MPVCVHVLKYVLEWMCLCEDTKRRLFLLLPFVCSSSVMFIVALSVANRERVCFLFDRVIHEKKILCPSLHTPKQKHHSLTERKTKQNVQKSHQLIAQNRHTHIWIALFFYWYILSTYTCTKIHHEWKSLKNFSLFFLSQK